MIAEDELPARMVELLYTFDFNLQLLEQVNDPVVGIDPEFGNLYHAPGKPRSGGSWTEIA